MMRPIAVLGVCILIAGVAIASPSNRPGTVTLDRPQDYSAIYALSDVHGMMGALNQLLSENSLIDAQGHWSGGKALVIVAGDSIDKGSQSIDVLDKWIALEPEARAAGGRILHLLGNHEAEFLANPTPSDDKAKALFEEMQARGIALNELTSEQFPRGRFLRSLPLAARVGNWLFCHAGFMPDLSWSELDQKASSLLNGGEYGSDLLIGPDSILEAKKWWKIGSSTRSELESRLDRAGLAGVVFGHQPKALNVEGALAQSSDGRLIKLDNGMAPEAGAHEGSLLLFTHPAELGVAGTQPEIVGLVHGKRKAVAQESRKDVSGD